MALLSADILREIDFETPFGKGARAVLQDVADHRHSEWRFVYLDPDAIRRKQ